MSNLHIVSSITKGSIIACLLVFFNILDCRADSVDSSGKIIKTANHETLPIQEEGETKIVTTFYGNIGVTNLEVVRHVLIVIVVIPDIDAPTKSQYSLEPIPLGSNFRNLFLSVISPNAP